MPTGFRARDVQVLRPYRDEIPWEHLEAGLAGDEAALAALDLDYLRIARYQGEFAGFYAITPRSPTRFELLALSVAPAYRRQGLGRWLLGHALGLAETKGGREMIAARPAAGQGQGFLRRAGFEPDGDRLCLPFLPE